MGTFFRTSREIVSSQCFQTFTKSSLTEMPLGKRCIREIETILEKAKERDDDPLALASIREMRQTLIDEQGQVNQFSLPLALVLEL